MMVMINFYCSWFQFLHLAQKYNIYEYLLFIFRKIMGIPGWQVAFLLFPIAGRRIRGIVWLRCRVPIGSEFDTDCLR